MLLLPGFHALFPRQHQNEKRRFCKVWLIGDSTVFDYDLGKDNQTKILPDNQLGAAGF
jgi:hypothetical protein